MILLCNGTTGLDGCIFYHKHAQPLMDGLDVGIKANECLGES